MDVRRRRVAADQAGPVHIDRQRVAHNRDVSFAERWRRIRRHFVDA
jgi:hypothetical protein